LEQTPTHLQGKCWWGLATGQSPLIFKQINLAYAEAAHLLGHMKQLKFDHKYVEDIVKGNKNTTIRIDDKHISVNDRLQVIDKTSNNNPQEWEVPGELIVNGIQEFLLEKIPLDIVTRDGIDIKSHAELYSFLRRFYGEMIGNKTVVKLISFEFEPYNNPVPYLLKKTLTGEEKLEQVKLFADGGSRGNPGPSASGYVILDTQEQILVSWNKYIGITTNNQAEYYAFVSRASNGASSIMYRK